ncbi:MAG: hypothetical protein RBS39_08380 [Phycisphaerales bacterium]|jgi:hypothetical protein|nr:hypothetical protein [Phycisphaerales bacterium]
MSARNTSGEWDRLEQLLRGPASDAQDLPDRNPRVEQFLKEIAMNARQKSPVLSRPAIGILIAGCLGASALAAAVTHQVMSRRAVLVMQDGQELRGEFTQPADGSPGQFVAEDGSVYSVDAATWGPAEPAAHEALEIE